MILSPISMKNYAGQCEFELPSRFTEMRKTSWGRRRANELRSYLNADKRPYIHLLDGGLSDNVGMRSVLETTALVGDFESYFQLLDVKNVRKLVYIMVSAETTPDVNQYMLNEIPGLWRASRALVDIPINRYSTDTFELMLLQHTQQTILAVRGKIPNFIEENRSPFGKLETSQSLLERSSESAFFVAEELRGDQRLRDRRTIDADKCT